MADTPYLVAIALVELDGRRALPLGGQSWAAAQAETEPGEVGHSLALDLLLRLLQRSEQGALRRLAGDDSLLLLEMPLEQMSERLPQLKATWLAGGSTEALLGDLRALSGRGWRVTTAKYEGVSLTPLA
jgi:hypothetical protein